MTPRPTGAHIFAAEYFAEEVRREIYERYGEKKLYEGGLSVRTTLNPKLQVIAKKALTDGLVRFDEARAGAAPAEARNRGRLGREARRGAGALRHSLAARGRARGHRSGRRIGLQPPRERSGPLSAERETGAIPLDGVKWAK